MKKLGLALAALVVLCLVVAGGGYAWGRSTSQARLTAHHVAHEVDFPIPFPLTDAEKAELTAADPNADLAALAKERAIARGKHLVESRYACGECHGKDFGGAVMVDAPPIGTIKGKNLTLGEGGVTKNYTAKDWDRMVRHGIKPNGEATVMPSEDYAEMSDRELSDVVSYIHSLPPVNATVPDPKFGPVGTMLLATGKIRVSAEFLPHQKAHAVEAPAETTPEFGKHLVSVCTGCHNPELTGGPIVGGPPDWPAARNLTPHADGLAGWTYEDFKGAMLEGKRKNGEALKQPMANMKTYAQNLTEPEMQAMWKYLQSLEAKPSPKP